MKKLDHRSSIIDHGSFIQALYITLIFLLPFGQLLRFQLTPSAAIYPHDIISALIFIAFLVHTTLTRKPIPQNLFTRWILAFSLVATASFIFNLARFTTFPLTSALHLARFLIHTSLLVSTAYFLKHRLLKLDLTGLLTQSLFILTVLGLLQFIFLPDTRFLYNFGWDDHLNRLIGTIFDPGFTGIILVFGAVLAHFQPKFKKLTPFFIAAALLTYSRATFLAMLVTGLAYTLILKRSLKQSAFLIISLTLLILFLPRGEGDGVKLERAYSVESRVESTVEATNQAKQNPLIGIGFNNYRYTLPSYPDRPIVSHTNSPDNSYAFVYVTTGLIGISVYLYFFARALFWSYRHNHTIFLVLVALGVHAVANNTLFYPFVTIPLWILIAHQTS